MAAMQLLRVLTGSLLVVGLCTLSPLARPQSADPLAEVFAGELQPAVESLIEQFRASR